MTSGEQHMSQNCSRNLVDELGARKFVLKVSRTGQGGELRAKLCFVNS
jgi:hypothetical protein